MRQHQMGTPIVVGEHMGPGGRRRGHNNQAEFGGVYNGKWWGGSEPAENHEGQRVAGNGDGECRNANVSIPRSASIPHGCVSKSMVKLRSFMFGRNWEPWHNRG